MMESSGNSGIDTTQRWKMLGAKAMPAPTPIISVIVVCKNPGPHLPAALASVWEQHPVPAELVVVDGGSTDGTREWLETQRRQIATLISEPDRGVYDAMNKGLAAAHGDWVLFLGADDRLAGARVLSEAVNWMEKNGADVAVGEAIYDDGRIYKLGPRVNPLARNFVHHQAAFYRRTLFAAHGHFDPSLAIMADYEFNLRLWKSQAHFEPVPLRIAACGSGGLSDAGGWRGYGEEIRVRHRYFPARQCWFWDALSVVRYVRKKIIRGRSRSPM
jgi:glycosyltransferase involved in cell wall biosynthesis